MDNIENNKKYNTNRIDITRIMLSSDFVLSNYLNDESVVALMSLGVPCGAIQSVFRGKDISTHEEKMMSDEELGETRKVYVPINSLQELAEHRATHFGSYTINLNYIEPKKMQSFMYRFNLLTDLGMHMFNIDEINNHQVEMLNDIPLTYEKLEKLKEKYITLQVQKKYLEENKRLDSKRFYELLDEDGQKRVGNMYLEMYDRSHKEDEEELE